ncbi:MAG: GT4 family glycosyltransferase PelF, partial [Lachnospiraceae bacterium]|nr:GT4 family glycosyltransferase PelF [Lachnospiraceae bacterium]
MKICIVAEGCYPYVVGGVSGWVHSLIKTFPDKEFILLSIVANRSWRGKFAYELPENLTEVHEVYLEDFDWRETRKKGKTFKLSKKEYQAMRSMVLNQRIDWDIIFHLFRDKKFSIDELLMGPDFYHIARECYKIRYPHIIFSDFLWTLRSIYLPLFFVLKTEVPPADLYHCVATGYAGVLGSMAKAFY